MVSSITASELAERLDREEAFVLVDTRPAESYRSWHVPGTRNLPFKPGENLDADRLAEIDADADTDADVEILTICAEGVSSKEFAERLEAMGYDDVTLVEGGMAAWSAVYDVVPVPTDDETVEVLQVQRRAKGCLGYVVGDRGTETAAAVDVSRHVDEYERAAAEAGYELVGVFDTHVHADHLSGGRALADDLGVSYHLGAAAKTRDPRFEYVPIERNEVVTVGNVELKAVPTPGHTSDIVSYLANAEAVLTGDTLFVESVGRTELQYSGAEAVEGAYDLYVSLHRTLLSLPDSVSVLPGHVTVTESGAWDPGTPGTPVVATIGRLRRDLPVLGLDEAAFVDRVTADLPAKPPNYETVIAVNTGRETLEDDAEATELELGPNRCAAP
jgi:glyoxylase-like metal-dependent hydrolase (beta-lactamase superfamily II)